MNTGYRYITREDKNPFSETFGKVETIKAYDLLHCPTKDEHSEEEIKEPHYTLLSEECIYSSDMGNLPHYTKQSEYCLMAEIPNS